jgi:NTP pyrophosphatase (non-canonical NTP hydrolase)
MMACFGAQISGDGAERNHRFLEESLELVQAGNCTRDDAHLLVDYVFNRDVGEQQQEVGGVMVTLAALCLAYGIDMHEAGETELARVWTKVEQIRAKQAGKPKHSSLPQHVSAVTVAQAMTCPEVAALVEGMQWLRRIVEEIDGALVHGTWRDDHGGRFKDTWAWVEAYVALAALEASAIGRDVVVQG